MHTSTLLNDHSWYTLTSAWDWARAGLWCASNLVTALAYYWIPIEIFRWRLAAPLASIRLFASLFIAFIAFCGTSHLAMLFIMQTAPWWAIGVYVGMGAVSVATLAAMRFYRSEIIPALHAFFMVYGHGPD